MENLVLFKSSGIESATIVYCLMGLLLLVCLIIYLSYCYQRFKKFKAFEAEMNMLELGHEQEDTLSMMVKRHALNEPVQILYSLRTFDEMATKEINRILASPGSSASKQKFVDLIYDIRQKTYHQDLIRPGTQNNELQQSGKANENNPFPSLPNYKNTSNMLVN